MVYGGCYLTTKLIKPQVNIGGTKLAALLWRVLCGGYALSFRLSRACGLCKWEW